MRGDAVHPGPAIGGVIDLTDGQEGTLMFGRPRRPLGHQRVGLLRSASVPLSVFLRDHHCAPSEQRVPVVVSGTTHDEALTLLREGSSSRLLPFARLDDSHPPIYYVDREQAAALLAHHEQADAFPDPLSLTKEPIRNLTRVQASGKANLAGRLDSLFGLPVPQPRSLAACQWSLAVTDRIRSQGQPGVMAPIGGLSLHKGDWVALAKNYGAATAPSRLISPAIVGFENPDEALPTLRRWRGKLFWPGHLSHTPNSTTGPQSGLVKTDRVIRLAIGAYPGEEVSVVPITRHYRSGWSRPPMKRLRPLWLYRGLWRLRQFVLPCVSVVARVQPAELTLAEQNAVMVGSLVLDALGVKSGDEVVIHSVSELSNENRLGRDGGWVHLAKKMKAYGVPDDVQDRRRRHYGGEWTAGLPSDAHTLGDPSELPWVWMDASVRKQLALPDKFGAVIISPSRQFVLSDHVREFAWTGLFGLVAILLALAAVPVQVASGSPVDDSLRTAMFWVVVVATILSMIAVFWRVRTRLR